MFGSTPKPKKKEIVTPPPVMPTVDDAAVNEAKRKRVQAAMQRHGRSSTFLSPSSDGTVLGGGA